MTATMEGIIAATITAAGDSESMKEKMYIITSLCSYASEFITITTSSNKLNPITYPVAGYLTLRMRNGRLGLECITCLGDYMYTVKT